MQYRKVCTCGYLASLTTRSTRSAGIDWYKGPIEATKCLNCGTIVRFTVEDICSR